MTAGLPQVSRFSRPGKIAWVRHPPQEKWTVQLNEWKAHQPKLRETTTIPQ